MAELQPVHDQLARLRAGLRRWTLCSGALVVGAAWLWLTLLFVLCDLLLQLSPGWCWAGFVVVVAGLATGVGLLVQLGRRQLSQASVSRRIEAQAPGLKNRLINVVQFAASAQPAEREFARLLLAERPVDLRTVASRRLFPRDWLRYPAGLAGAGLLVAALVLVCSPRGCLTSLGRLLAPMAGLAPYSLTRLVAVEPGDAVVVKGNALPLTVRCGGVPPESAQVEWQPERLAPRTFALERSATAGAFGGQTPPLFTAARYRVRAGDARSAWYQVRVDSLPALDGWQVTATPPAYTGAAPFQLRADGKTFAVPQGAALRLTGRASQNLAGVELWQAGQRLAAVTCAGQPGFTVAATPPGDGPLEVCLTSAPGLAAKIALPLTFTPDAPPAVDFVTAERRLPAGPLDTLPLEFLATDNYGVKRVVLQQVRAPDDVVDICRADATALTQQRFAGRFLLDLASFHPKPGSRLRFRLLAVDHGPESATRVGLSRGVEVYVPLPAERRLEQQRQTDLAGDALKDLIAKQQDNLKASREGDQQLRRRQPFPDAAREALLTRQAAIRELAAKLLPQGAALGALQPVLQGLVELEMRQAVEACAALVRAPAAEQPARLAAGIQLQIKILAALTGLPGEIAFERRYQEKTDLLLALQKIAAGQRRNLQATQQAQEQRLADAQVSPLADAQDDLASRADLFLDESQRRAKAEGDDFAEQLRQVNGIMTDNRLYEKLLGAAEQLAQVNLPAAIQSQEECLKLLLECLDLINKWRVNQAHAIGAKVKETLQQVGEKLQALEAKQQRIVEVTADLAKRDKLDQEAKATLRKMDAEQEAMKAEVEQMAQDLYQFPELPVAGELNGKMREIYEDVEQAAHSADEPAVTIAVQKEDALLEAIKSTKERVEDVEMWLPDKPDNVKWDMESFDAAEFPEMPLVPLPDELEDLVGELLDQAAALESQAQDATGNNMLADAEMGWDVMDGPMPNFSAKGKSGNARPNDNEMTGRSGAGREGQANGELVENKVKGLEGRETHARKTNDPFQPGQVQEEEDSNLTAKATGGGKLGGESDREGMFGNAPRRDLNLPPGDRLKQLRQETEALYATARLLYLGNGGNLGAAASELRQVERVDRTMKDLTIGQRVLRRLSDSRTELSAGTVLNLPVAAPANAGGAAALEDVDLETIDGEYRGLVSDYYKGLNE